MRIGIHRAGLFDKAETGFPAPDETRLSGRQSVVLRMWRLAFPIGSRSTVARFFCCGMLAIAVLLSACAGNPRSPVITGDKAAVAADEQSISQESPKAELLYELLVGEIAGQRGAVDIATENYLRAARHSDDPRIAERAAKIAVYAGDKEKALAAAERWVELAPENSEAQQVVAIMYLRNGRVDDAVPYLERVRDTHAEQRYKGFMFVAQLLGREQDKKSALQAMSRVVEKHPEEAEALFAYAHLAMRAEQYTLAHQLLDKVEALRPDWSDAYLLRAKLYQAEEDIDAAVAAYRKAIALRPDDLEMRLSFARMLVEERRLAQAREEFKRLEKRAPDNADVLFALGLLALQAEQAEEAKRYFSRLIHNGQRIPDASFFLGRIVESEGKDQEALRWYRKVNGGNNYFEARLRIAILTARQGKVDDARALLQDLVVDNPAQEIRVLLVESDILRQDRRYEEAFEVLSRGLADYPDNPELLYAHAMAAERLGRIDVLERDLRKMLEADPDNAQVLNALGYTLADRTTRYDEAYRYIKQALELEPEDPAILDSMGWVLYRLGRHQEAIDYLRKALEKAKAGDAEIAAHLGEVLWVVGEEKEARKIWEKARERHPDDEILRDTMQRFLK